MAISRTRRRSTLRGIELADLLPLRYEVPDQGIEPESAGPDQAARRSANAAKVAAGPLPYLPVRHLTQELHQGPNLLNLRLDAWPVLPFVARLDAGLGATGYASPVDLVQGQPEEVTEVAEQ